MTPRINKTASFDPINKQDLFFRLKFKGLRDRCKIYTCETKMTIEQQKKLVSQEQIK